MEKKITTEATLIAMYKAIEKWYSIRYLGATDLGMVNCALCQLFLPNCYLCPLGLPDKGQKGCKHNAYGEWYRHYRDIHKDPLNFETTCCNCIDCTQLAHQMLNFLYSETYKFIKSKSIDNRSKSLKGIK